MKLLNPKRRSICFHIIDISYYFFARIKIINNSSYTKIAIKYENIVVFVIIFKEMW